jgi:hypothetical protein
VFINNRGLKKILVGLLILEKSTPGVDNTILLYLASLLDVVVRGDNQLEEGESL